MMINILIALISTFVIGFVALWAADRVMEPTDEEKKDQEK